MRRFGFLIVLALALTCATGAFAWFDNFDSYTTGGGDISSNWTVPTDFDPFVPHLTMALPGGIEPGGLAATSTTGDNPGAYAYRLTGSGTGILGVLTGKIYIGTAPVPLGGGRIGVSAAAASTQPWGGNNLGPLINVNVYKNNAGQPVIDLAEYAPSGALAYVQSSNALSGSTDWVDVMIDLAAGGAYTVSYKYQAGTTWTVLATRTEAIPWAPDKVWIAPAQGAIDDVGFLAAGSAAQGITGSITLQDIQSTSDKSLLKIRADLRTHGTTTVLQSALVRADGSGNFAYSFSPLETGQYDVAFSSAGFLRKVIAATVVSGQTATQNASLMNGDVNGDNQVDSADKGIVQGNLDVVGAQ